MADTPLSRSTAGRPTPSPRRTLAVACGAHALHDGYTDVLYLLLPVWQAAFGLSYGEIGLMRSSYSVALATFQIPASRLAGRLGNPIVLALGTGLAGCGFLLMGSGGGLVCLCAGLLVGGLGSSTQHPIASDLVARAYPGRRSRGMLGTYNFSGDVGKIVVPATASLLLTLVVWQSVVLAIGALGLVVALLILANLPADKATPAEAGSGSTAPGEPDHVPGRGGFRLLLALGIVDSATRTAFLTFLPFVLTGKGAEVTTVGLALTLLFAGGAVGKFVCGYLGQVLGVLATVILTEIMTALGVVAVLNLSLAAGLLVLPLVGIALNGTSSVLYGSVPELVSSERRARAFGVFYTGTIGSGALAPILLGRAGDVFGVEHAMLLIAAAALATLPIAWWLNAYLPHSAVVVGRPEKSA